MNKILYMVVAVAAGKTAARTGGRHMASKQYNELRSFEN